LIETFKILSGKEHVNCGKYFELANVTSGLRGHSLKLFKPRCRATIRQNFFSLRIVSDWNELPQEVGGCAVDQHVQEQAGSTLE